MARPIPREDFIRLVMLDLNSQPPMDDDEEAEQDILPCHRYFSSCIRRSFGDSSAAIPKEDFISLEDEEEPMMVEEDFINSSPDRYFSCHRHRDNSFRDSSAAIPREDFISLEDEEGPMMVEEDFINSEPPIPSPDRYFSCHRHRVDNGFRDSSLWKRTVLVREELETTMLMKAEMEELHKDVIAWEAEINTVRSAYDSLMMDVEDEIFLSAAKLTELTSGHPMRRGY